MDITSEETMETIYAKFVDEWGFLWTGGDEPLNELNQAKIENDLQNALEEAYSLGWQDGKADARME